MELFIDWVNWDYWPTGVIDVLSAITVSPTASQLEHLCSIRLRRGTAVFVNTVRLKRLSFPGNLVHSVTRLCRLKQNLHGLIRRAKKSVRMILFIDWIKLNSRYYCFIGYKIALERNQVIRLVLFSDVDLRLHLQNCRKRIFNSTSFNQYC